VNDFFAPRVLLLPSLSLSDMNVWRFLFSFAGDSLLNWIRRFCDSTKEQEIKTGDTTIDYKHNILQTLTMWKLGTF
jgi:hypothetical protein